MDKKRLLKSLHDFKEGELSEGDLLRHLQSLPFEDLGFAKVDHHRGLRTGFSEVVYCEGKTEDQIESIFLTLTAKCDTILLTRADPSVYQRLRGHAGSLRYHESCRVIVYQNGPVEEVGSVLVLAAGTSDLPVAEEAAVTARALGCKVKQITDVGVAGLHRLLSHLDDIYGATCIIAVAGMDGAMIPTVGGLASCPVIAVPTSVGYGASFQGLAALLGMLNSCSAGVSVMNIDNGFGAGYFAALMQAQMIQTKRIQAKKIQAEKSS